MKRAFVGKVVAVGGSAALAAGNALSAPITVDTADVVAQIGVAPVAIGAIALAVLGVIAIIKTYKWVRRGF